MAERILVQVCYALPDATFLKELQLEPGATLMQAVQASGLVAAHPEVDPTVAKMGIYGKLKAPDTVLRAGDRVEVYRPLLADPKDTRRRRAQRKQSA